MLSGRYPFDDDEVTEVERKHLEATAPRPSELVPLHPVLDEIIMRCLEKQPERRFASAKEFIDTFARALEGDQIPDVRTNAVPRKGVAIYAEMRLPEGETSEEILLDILPVLDAVELQMRSAGFTIGLQTSSAVLGIKLLSEAQDTKQKQVREAFDLAAVLKGVELPPSAHTIQLSLSLHVDDVNVVGEASDTVAGALSRVGSWATANKHVGLYVTPQAQTVISGIK